MSWRAQIDDRGAITRYKDVDTGEVISAKEYDRRQQVEHGQSYLSPDGSTPQMTSTRGQSYPVDGNSRRHPESSGVYARGSQYASPASQPQAAPDASQTAGMPAQSPYISPMTQPAAAADNGVNPLIQPGAKMLTSQPGGSDAPGQAVVQPQPEAQPQAQSLQQKNLRLEGIPHHENTQSMGRRSHGFLDATSIAILLPTLVLLALIIAAAHKKRLFPWQTIRTFNPPSGLMSPREYERSYLCPPNLRRMGRLGKRDPKASWNETDGIVVPFGFLARTHLPVTIPLGRLPNKNMFIVAPSGSGKTTLMRAVIKSMLAKPCVIIALEAKANDPNLDERREGFKYTVLPEAQQAGFNTLYFNPLDADSINWNPLDLDPITFASSIVQDVNSLPPEEQHWAERDHGYIAGLATLLKWGAVMIAGEDENGIAQDVQPLPCNPRGLMRLVNNRRNIVESMRRLKSSASVDPAELSEMTQALSSIIRTDTDWDKNIQGIRGRLRMFKNPNVLRVTERSNVDLRVAMHQPTVLIFGAPASLGPDAESLASCFVYQLQQALHTRYGTANVLPLFAFFDEYQTLNLDIAGRLSAIVRGANGGLTVILQNISQIAGRMSVDPTAPGGSELKTIFSNSAIRVCLHNADESTAKFFSDEIGKHAVIVPGISDHYDSKGFGIFPTTWNRIHSQQVVSRIDTDSIKRMEKHHALVYLSPAGDGEFGETKPFMCDLRGIEEIARLHLLHNVTGRSVPPSGQEVAAGSLPPGVVMGSDGSDNGALSADALAAGLASASANRTCPHCGQAAGKGRFCIECGRPIVAIQPAAGPAHQESEPEPEAAPAAEPPSPFEAVPVSLPTGVADMSSAVTSPQTAAISASAISQTAGSMLPFAQVSAQLAGNVTGSLIGVPKDHGADLATAPAMSPSSGNAQQMMSGGPLPPPAPAAPVPVLASMPPAIPTVVPAVVQGQSTVSPPAMQRKMPPELMPSGPFPQAVVPPSEAAVAQPAAPRATVLPSGPSRMPSNPWLDEGPQGLPSASDSSGSGLSQALGTAGLTKTTEAPNSQAPNRAPLTSLSPDPSRLPPIVRPPTAPPPGGQPGQNRPGNGVEF